MCCRSKRRIMSGTLLPENCVYVGERTSRNQNKFASFIPPSSAHLNSNATNRYDPELKGHFYLKTE